MTAFGLNLKPAMPLVPTMARLERNVSASQLKTWNSCRRKWAFEKVWGVKARQMQAHVIGHALHGVAERYITAQADLFPPGWNDGLDNDERAWVQMMTRKAVEKGVWQAVPGSLIEFPIAFLTAPEHVDARGLPLLAKAETYLDATKTRRIAKLTTLYDGSPLPVGWDRLPPFVGFIDHLLLWENPPRVSDHKTSKNRRYATTAKKLAEDTQVLSYAAVPLVLRPEVTEVRMRHNIFIKEAGGPDPYCVEVPVTLEKVSKTWSDIRQAVVDMKHVREIAPKVVIEGNAYARANNWQKVKSAVEEGRADEACGAYGGCPFKDICFGRATAESVVRQLDSPDPLALLKTQQAPAPPVTFGLNLKSKLKLPTNAIQEPPMPFALPKPALAVGQDVYVLDPDNAAIQFRSRILKIGTEISIALYPNADVTPDFASLPITYHITLPTEAILPIPSITAKVTGYYDVLKEAGTPEEAIAWVTHAGTPGAPPSIVPSTKPVTRPERDGAFGLKGVTAPATTPAPAVVTPAPATTAPAANPPLVGPTPEWAKTIVPGATLIVNAGGVNAGHKFWGPLARKEAKVIDVGPGDNGTMMITVEIEGGPYPDVDSRRFINPAVPAAAEVESDPLAQYKARVGQAVSVSFKSSLSSLNAVLEAVDADGVTLIGKKYAWSDVSAFNELTLEGIPGSKEQIKAQKAAAKIAAKEAAKVAPMVGTAPATTSVMETMDAAKVTVTPAPQEPAHALAKAIDTVNVALTGKVTKKVLEAIVPLLAQAKAYQESLEGERRPGVPTEGGYEQALTDVEAAFKAAIHDLRY